MANEVRLIDAKDVEAALLDFRDTMCDTDFVSVLGHMTDAGDFPAVRECYHTDNGFYFPALREIHPIDKWAYMPVVTSD